MIDRLVTGSAVSRAIAEEVRGRLAGASEPDARARLAVEVQAVAARHGSLLGVEDLEATTQAVRAQLWGLGPLEALVTDPDVTDVLVNGPDSVHVDRGAGLERVDVDLGDEGHVRAMAVRLATTGGRRLDEACPWVDVRLPGGVRLHAVLPPVVVGGTHLSLRVIRSRGRSLSDLAAVSTFPAAWHPVLRGLVAERVAFLVSGGTGAGKTTLLSALLSVCPPSERLVLVEDVAELVPDHPHVVRLESRHANVEGRGAATLQDLLRQALRMRPDRLVVGECRGAEVRELLAALNTGHAGGCGTVHANSPVEVPARLEALAALAGMSPQATRAQAAAGLDALVHVTREGPLRRVSQIAVVEAGAAGPLTVLPALSGDPDPRAPGHRGPGWERLAARLRLDVSRWP